MQTLNASYPVITAEQAATAIPLTADDLISLCLPHELEEPFVVDALATARRLGKIYLFNQDFCVLLAA